MHRLRAKLAIPSRRKQNDFKGDLRIKTAENFIDGIAAKSSTSGKTYQIRKPDGTLVTTSAYFYARLKEFEEAKSAP
jgi:hypothetical protein